MKYGFVIDNRKCIGCHACTTACKSEHDIPVGVNRTWVKQVEKGEFPNTRRLFSVMRCNHCTDAPCVDICPTEALYTREDGIVDFDKDRCIGCKSCMQACPYDALYIDPETSTAAKCNYCAHRVDVGLEPACVNVCPEHAIISGDMDNPDSEISELLARQQVKVRKGEKGTVPNLFYIDGDDASLVPSATPQTDTYIWSQQNTGVGHFAKEAEKLAFSNGDAIDALMKLDAEPANQGTPKKSVEVLMGKEARRVYDTPDKGILWGWEVSAYVWTKAVSTGVFLILAVAMLFNFQMPLNDASNSLLVTSLVISMVFLLLTGVLLVKDLDRPDRFLYVLLRPHWSSWLVKGGYGIGIFGTLILVLGMLFSFECLEGQCDNLILAVLIILPLSIIAAIFTSIYTAFLFGQAKGRDFWQSPTLVLHMIIHSVMAGGAVFSILSIFGYDDIFWLSYMKLTLIIGIIANLFVLFIELTMTHPTVDSKRTVDMILKGRYKKMFWFGVILLGNVLPMILLFNDWHNPLFMTMNGIFVLIGLYLTNHIWVEAPQRIALT